MAQLSKIYSDLDLRFNPQPGTKDVSLSYDDQAVIRSIKNLLLTNEYERLWSPTIGSRVTHLLFEPLTPLVASSLEEEIKRVIINWEPRAQIQSIEVKPNVDQNYYVVSLYLYISNQTTPSGIQLILKRTR